MANKFLQTLEDQQAHPPTTLHERFKVLPSTLQQICGTIKIPQDGGCALAEVASQGNLLSASDGSARGLAGMHTCTLTMGPTNMDLLIGYGPVDSTEHAISSYHAELQGHLALLIIATLLVQALQVTITTT